MIRRGRRAGAGGRLVAYLIATVDLPDPAVRTGAHLDTAAGWIGLDLGIENIAVTSDRALAAELMGTYGAGAPDGAAGRGHVKDRRTRNREIRQKLQAKNTKSAKRLLRQRVRREARFAADVNHQISKRIVAEAERTGRGIAVEESTGIRERVRLRKPQYATHSSWVLHRSLLITLVDKGFATDRCTQLVEQPPGEFNAQSCELPDGCDA